MDTPSSQSNSVADLTQLAVDFSRARDWQQFHSTKNLTMALAGEVGEVASLLQWVEPGALETWLGNNRETLADEVADVAIYLLLLARSADIDLASAVIRKIRLNEARYPVDRARGTATKYNQL